MMISSALQNSALVNVNSEPKRKAKCSVDGVIVPSTSKNESKDVEDLTLQLIQLRLKKPTCYVYDSFMARHRSLTDPNHPEKADRLSAIFKQLLKDGLLKSCVKLKSRFATRRELCSIHDDEYLDRLVDICSGDDDQMIEAENDFESIYFCADTYKCSHSNGFALIRPPGHHAFPSTASGFCFLNNVALAAEFAVEKFSLRRILILDWDVHHGNGTQSVFYDRSDVLYISLHRYDDCAFYPGPECGPVADADKIGLGAGVGFNVNIPWNGARMGDNEYLMAIREIVMPIARMYNPELVLISAGFDAAAGDPLGGYRLTPQCFARMTLWLSELAGGRLILILEGGYNLTSISSSMSACVEILVKEKSETLDLCSDTKSPCKSAVKSVKKVKQILNEYWSI
uniref:Histone deacetylase domain-containing protein n=1 Tax=Romanomermis culicivorax TaxID=13658 RepID=A0A915KFC4_ROMCU